MPTDRIAEQQTRRWVNFKPAIVSVIDGVGQSRIGDSEPGAFFVGVDIGEVTETPQERLTRDTERHSGG